MTATELDAARRRLAEPDHAANSIAKKLARDQDKKEESKTLIHADWGKVEDRRLMSKSVVRDRASRRKKPIIAAAKVAVAIPDDLERHGKSENPRRRMNGLPQKPDARAAPAIDFDFDSTSLSPSPSRRRVKARGGRSNG